MARKTKYNPERRAWRGISYRKGGKQVRDCQDPVRDLCQLLRDLHVHVTFDPKATIRGPCWLCGVPPEDAHNLLVVAVRLDEHQTPVRRPICTKCQEELVP